MTTLFPAGDSVGTECINCGAAISPKAKFCEECGANQSAPLASSRGPVKEILLDSKFSGITPQTSENPMRSSAASNQSSNPSEARSVDERASTQKKLFLFYGIVAAVIVLVGIGAWYLRASERQKATDDYNLGTAYENGQGVPKDEAQAVIWFRKAAELGNVEAQYSLGVMYDSGQGVSQDHSQAAYWFRKAADQGSPKAQSFLAILYMLGEGVPQDSSQGVSWFRKSAEQGDARSESNLGHCYETGNGVQQDYAQAIVWYQKAADQGDSQATHALANLRARQEQQTPTANAMPETQPTDTTRNPVPPDPFEGFRLGDSLAQIVPALKQRGFSTNGPCDGYDAIDYEDCSEQRGTPGGDDFEVLALHLHPENNGKLYEVEYLFPKDRYDAVLKHLQEKYGQPESVTNDARSWRLKRTVQIVLFTHGTYDAPRGRDSFEQYHLSKVILADTDVWSDRRVETLRATPNRQQ